jgi:L-serine dehydratase
VISLFELLKIGIGPSSSHTVGPMVAANRFVELLEAHRPDRVARIKTELYGSLALTGVGHRTDRAILLGLCGEQPQSVDTTTVDQRFDEICNSQQLRWLGRHCIGFDVRKDLIFHGDELLPPHPNGLRFTAFDAAGAILHGREYYSIGGGFVLDESEMADSPTAGSQTDDRANSPKLPNDFCSAAELLERCRESGLTIAEIVNQNERSTRSQSEIDGHLEAVWSVMRDCIDQGCRAPGVLPGGLGIRRRAPEIFRRLCAQQVEHRRSDTVSSDPLERMDWVNLFALAVSEQNASGARVVTAPTNGAAGIIPAVCSYYERFLPGASRDGVHTFLLTASAIGMLYKRNASLSAAEMGCQGEVGVACSMAAAGLAAVMGGSPSQIENAAEIGMEHNLGLTCDPVAGLVQIPCIERNTMGAIKAINAARLAVLYGDGTHRVSLDKVIEAMRQTGLDMQSKYKETSLGGLAVSLSNC